MNIRLYGKVDKFWNYRNARMTYDNIKIEVHVDNELHDKIEQFLKKNDCRIDNHICWKIGNVYYCYSDNVLYVGDGLTEGSY